MYVSAEEVDEMQQQTATESSAGRRFMGRQVRGGRVEGKEAEYGKGLRGGAGVLAVVAAGETGEGEVFIEVGPVDAEGGNLHMGKLRWGTSGKPRIPGNRKAKGGAIGEKDGNDAVGFTSAMLHMDMDGCMVVAVEEETVSFYGEKRWHGKREWRG